MTKPFSRVYLVTEVMERDSLRFRMRLGSFCREHFRDINETLVKRIEVETGTRVPTVGGYSSLDKFFQNALIRDVLDAITHINSVLASRGTSRSSEWRSFVARVFAEEATTYSIDATGSVTYAVDEAYALTRKATLAGLQHERWQAPKADFERAFEAMDRTPADTNSAIRSISAALESCTKILLGNSVARVGPSEIEKNLWPLVQSKYAVDPSAAAASHEILKSYAAWTNSAHQYRHGQANGNHGLAPEELAIATLTTGSAYLRWFLALENKGSE